jgi:hypothetical protein
MVLWIRCQFPTGSTLGYTIERLIDETFFDFNNSTFARSSIAPINPLHGDSENYAGRYKVTLDTIPASVFTDGDCVITIHDRAASNLVAGEPSVVTDAWSDAAVISRSSLGAATDPWVVPLPGSGLLGTAEAILGSNLDTKASSRSTFTSGTVDGINAPVTVGTNNDKAGYTPAPAGLDAVLVESAINARQALSPILAASAGVLLRAGTGTMVIKGGGIALRRIMAVTDDAGNRAAVTLTLPQ